MKQNLTIQIDTEVVHQARVLAARQSTSVSRLVADELQRLVREDRQYEAAARKARSYLGDGFHLGDGPLPPREELHER